ncbi:RNA polymerase sigma factor [Pseudomonas sp. Marseille-Q5115]|uniref:RNA polymerase sigma factor n=1 Tax=Pseudomonas sp. Marseille-Q5115 TaxID=2866593 RepID=UPI001CE47273|nr:sigma-70 family RNA polymerase sigma factor [Pseudomonas sp. Marseille-Q5115]
MNPSRLDVVFLRQRLSLLRTLQGLVRNASVAEDLLHETWLRVSRALAERPVDHLEPFVFQTARNLALDHLRAQRRHARLVDTELPAHALHNVAEERSSAEDAAYAERLLRRLSTEVAGFTPRQREIFVRNRLHGQPCPAIANELGISASTVQKELKQIMLICLHATGHGSE